MAIKSSWAYKNGQRMARGVKEAQKRSVPKFGWVDRNFSQLYAERVFNEILNEYALSVKTYSNKKQVNNKVEKLRQGGIECESSTSYPFVIIKR